MAELIRKEEVIEKIWSVYNRYGNNSLAFSDEKTRAIDKACGLVQREVEKLPTVTEAEIRAKAIDEFARKLLINFNDWQMSVAEVGREKEYETIGKAIIGIEEIAEQLKGE